MGGGGLGAEMGTVVCADSAFESAASSSQDSATVMGFVRTLGAWVSGEIVSLSRDDCSAEADADVDVIAAVLRGQCGGIVKIFDSGLT